MLIKKEDYKSVCLLATVLIPEGEFELESERTYLI